MHWRNNPCVAAAQTLLETQLFPEGHSARKHLKMITKQIQILSRLRWQYHTPDKSNDVTPNHTTQGQVHAQ